MCLDACYHMAHMCWLCRCCCFCCSAGTTSTSIIIPVSHQAAGSQPYPRSAQSKAINITLGSGSNKVSYSFTVDTGSAVLLATCRTRASLANCGNSPPASKNCILGSTSTVADKATCKSTGIGCMLAPSNTCFLSEQVRVTSLTENEYIVLGQQWSATIVRQCLCYRLAALSNWSAVIALPYGAS